MFVHCPIGSVIPYAGDVSSPTARQVLAAGGWLVCDGSTVDAALFPELYAVLGDIYGAAEPGASRPTFKLPDYRGQFLRGVDDRGSESARDPDAHARLNADLQTNTGNSGAKVGSTQDFAFQGHEHSVMVGSGATTGEGSGAFSEVTSGQTTAIISADGYGDVKVATETRPTNVAINFLVKARTHPLSTWPGWVPGPV